MEQLGFFRHEAGVELQKIAARLFNNSQGPSARMALLPVRANAEAIVGGRGSAP